MTDKQKLIDTINEVWEKLYPGSEPVTDLFSLTMRIKNIAEDRNCCAFNARVLQKALNEAEAKALAVQEIGNAPHPA